MRLDQALARLLPDQSRSRLQAWILRKQITVENRDATPKHRVWGGEKVQVNPVPSPDETAYIPEAISLDIVHEDESLIVINKPPGLVVHPGSGNWQGTMLNALLHHAPQLKGIPRAGIVHRLDKDTSGLLVVAKTPEAQTSLVRQLQEHSVKRIYIALVLGHVTCDGWVDAPIGRHPVHRTKMAVTTGGKEARTYYQVIEKLEGCTMLRCTLETGRTHQIRVHLAHLGFPIAGDDKYGDFALNKQLARRTVGPSLQRMFLHAGIAEVAHPVTGEQLRLEATLSDDLREFLKALDSEATPS